MIAWSIVEFEFSSDELNSIDDTMREIRHLGCNGPNDQNKFRCQRHCMRQGYRTGSCSEIDNYKICVCIKSPLLTQKYSELLQFFFNISSV
ncbi:unnamed protein product [Rotaria sp. Silwood1]|nr:unnamed protein product [Rotaria sp. Silwood1]